MEQALRLGIRGQGATGSNPAVGCVIVSADGAVVGSGWTQSGGRPHAETEALDEAGSARAAARPMSRWSHVRIQAKQPLAPMHW